ncbi:flagellar hook-associated protein FlgK [Magnetospira sp. QH-2]|uniref:flagellar hook-associated protein FlgK n=1 Tax=Magnetospira sp. (strain QH-2) TaxID=1288970 RepID=UPI0003E80FF2|nr:flagellar hook-associated protein FlgK [Magnetospira sp. QH-2]CCQ74135.1 flagellar hook-associated protein 1 (HAP1) FlgK [Magnetospira sp. QH-2]
MAGNITLALQTATSGLMASQAGLDVVANNIANSNTEGYSRKIANFEQRVVAADGAGVQIAEVTRIVDENLLKSFRRELGNTAEVSVKMDYFDRVQNLFGEPADNDSVAHLIEELTMSFETLSTSPERTFEQAEVVRRATEIGVKLNLMTNTLQDMRWQADKAIADATTRINNLSSEIEDMNNKIVTNSTIGHDVTDLLDKRDMALDELSSYLDIQYFTRENNDVVVFTEGGVALIDHTARQMTHIAASQLDATVTHSKGNIGAITLSGGGTSEIDITGLITRGELKGLIDLRDHTLTDLQSQLDMLAGELRDTVNALHNDGAPFPGLTSATGTRTFVDPSTQTITLSGGDVTVALLDTSGDQVAATTLDTIMQSTTYGSLAAGLAANAKTATGPWDITEIAATLQSYIQANGGSTSDTVTVNTAGNLEINISTSNLGIVFRDETATANGSTNSDVTIQYDANGDGTVDRHVSGFSTFFGLNDLFVDGLDRTRHDSDIKASNYTWRPTNGMNMMFKDGTSTAESITLLGGTAYSLSDIAELINDANDGISFVTATVIPDGSGNRLRLEHDDGQVFEVLDDQGVGGTDSFIENLGLEMSDARAAQFFGVRSDIVSSPALQSRGVIQWNADLGINGEYFLSIGDNTISQNIAEMMTNGHSFEATGGLYDQTVTFSEYGGAILSYNAGLVATTERTLESQETLSEALREQADNYSGVNLDQEMANLLIFQQSFSAAARVINIITQMFDDLESMIR